MPEQPDFEMLEIAFVMAGYHVEAGSRRFPDFAIAMTADVGDLIRPYLKLTYNAVRDSPGLESWAKEMDDYATVQAFDLDALLQGPPTPSRQNKCF